MSLTLTLSEDSFLLIDMLQSQREKEPIIWQSCSNILCYASFMFYCAEKMKNETRDSGQTRSSMLYSD